MVPDTGTAHAAQQEAGDVARHAQEAGGQVAQHAVQEARDVAGEATAQAKDLLQQTMSQVQEQARDGQERAGTALTEVAQQLDTMSRSGDASGLGVDLVRQAAETTSRVGSWLQSRDPNDLIEDVRGYARRNPAMFLIGAGVLGLMVGRFGRGLKDSPSDSPARNTTPTSAASTPPVSSAGTVGYQEPPLGAAYGEVPAMSDPSAGFAATPPAPYPPAPMDPTAQPYGTPADPQWTGGPR